MVRIVYGARFGLEEGGSILPSGGEDLSCTPWSCSASPPTSNDGLSACGGGGGATPARGIVDADGGNGGPLYSNGGPLGIVDKGGGGGGPPFTGWFPFFGLGRVGGGGRTGDPGPEDGAGMVWKNCGGGGGGKSDSGDSVEFLCVP